MCARAGYIQPTCQVSKRSNNFSQALFSIHAKLVLFSMYHEIEKKTIPYIDKYRVEYLRYVNLKDIVFINIPITNMVSQRKLRRSYSEVNSKMLV